MRRIQRAVTAVTVLVLAGGCHTSHQTRALVDRARDNQKLLAEAQARSIRAHERTVRDARARDVQLAEALETACRTWAGAEQQAALARIDASEAEILGRFDERAWNLLTVEFDTEFERIYLRHVRRQGELEKERYERLARSHEIDAVAQRRADLARVQVLTLSQRSLADEAELRASLRESIAEVRGEVKSRLVDVFAAPRAEARALPTECELSGPREEAYQQLLDGLSSFQRSVEAAHVAQLEALVTIHAYINRRSAASLLLEGAGEALKSELTATLPGLGEMLSPLIEGGVGELDHLIQDATRRAEAFLDGKLKDLQAKLEGSIAATGRERAVGS